MKEATESSKSLTVEDYILLEEQGQIRHEYYHGKLFATPGETLLHNEICIKVLFLLRSALSGSTWKIYMESVKVKVENEDIYLYPDIVVMEENTAATLYKEYVIYNPTLIVEVLSDSTRKYDYTDKFILYQKISTLCYYLLVEPTKQVVMLYEKDAEGTWTAKTYTELSEVIILQQLGIEVSLNDIYA